MSGGQSRRDRSATWHDRHPPALIGPPGWVVVRPGGSGIDSQEFAWAKGWLRCPWRSAVCRPILDCVEFVRDLIGELLGWLGDVLGPLGEHLVHRQAGHALAPGRVACSLKVMSCRQQGLSSRWRSGVAAISPGRLDFTLESWLPSASRPLTHIVVLGPGRRPSREELTGLPGDCQVTALQTPTDSASEMSLAEQPRGQPPLLEPVEAAFGRRCGRGSGPAAQVRGRSAVRGACGGGRSGRRARGLPRRSRARAARPVRLRRVALVRQHPVWTPRPPGGRDADLSQRRRQQARAGDLAAGEDEGERPPLPVTGQVALGRQAPRERPKDVAARARRKSSGREASNSSRSGCDSGVPVIQPRSDRNAPGPLTLPP